MGVVAAAGYKGLTDVANRVAEYGNVSQIVVNVLDARQSEKNFVLRKDEQEAAKVAESVTQARELAAAASGGLPERSGQAAHGQRQRESGLLPHQPLNNMWIYRIQRTDC